MAIYTVHAGHAKQGNAFSGDSGYCNESTESRLIKDSVIKYLKSDGNSVFDCTVDKGSSQIGIISDIKSKINAHNGASANISIHLNSFDGSAKGTECCVYSTTGTTEKIAERICASISAMGFKNRGLKKRTDLAVLKGITNGGANILIEAFFCDSKSDFELYKSIGADNFGKVIAEAIVNHKIKQEELKMANVFQYTLDGSDKQKWKPELVNGKYMFKNKYNGKYLDVLGASGANLTRVQTYAKNDSAAQKFELKQIEKGYLPKEVAPFYIIPATNSGACLDIEDSSKNNNGNLIIYKQNGGKNQKFAIIDTGDGYWCIVNTNSLKALTV